MVDKIKEFMSKERLENITLPFRVIGPALTVLIFLAQIGLTVFSYYVKKADDESNKNIKLQYEQIKTSTDEIKASVKDLTVVVGANDRYTRDWRILVERELQKGEDFRNRLSFLEDMVYKNRGRKTQ